LETLLQIINDCWISGAFPSSWHQAVVLAIPKVDKDRTDPNDYHPVTLTSCQCKVVERTGWFGTWKNTIITKMQRGFRKCKSTTDVSKPLFPKLFVHKQHAFAFFLFGEGIQYNMEI